VEFTSQSTTVSMLVFTGDHEATNVSIIHGFQSPPAHMKQTLKYKLSES